MIRHVDNAVPPVTYLTRVGGLAGATSAATLVAGSELVYGTGTNALTLGTYQTGALAETAAFTLQFTDGLGRVVTQDVGPVILPSPAPDGYGGTDVDEDAIAAAVWDEDLSGHGSANSAGWVVRGLLRIAQAFGAK